MKKISVGRFISFGGILTSIAVIFQLAPVFLPAIGLLFSPLTTLPIAIAAFYRLSLGIIVFFSSAFIVAFVSVQEAVILLFTTGLLGVVIGALLYRKGIVVSIFFSCLLLTLGMIVLTYMLGISVFGDILNSKSAPFMILVFSLFSFVYVSIWNLYFKKFIKFLNKVVAE